MNNLAYLFIFLFCNITFADDLQIKDYWVTKCYGDPATAEYLLKPSKFKKLKIENRNICFYVLDHKKAIPNEIYEYANKHTDMYFGEDDPDADGRHGVFWKLYDQDELRLILKSDRFSAGIYQFEILMEMEQREIPNPQSEEERLKTIIKSEKFVHEITLLGSEKILNLDLLRLGFIKDWYQVDYFAVTIVLKKDKKILYDKKIDLSQKKRML